MVALLLVYVLVAPLFSGWDVRQGHRRTCHHDREFSPPSGRYARPRLLLRYRETDHLKVRPVDSRHLEWRTRLVGSTRSMRSALLAYATVCALGPYPDAAVASDDCQHGISFFGDFKYPPGFAHFDYVNPNAPKGGTLGAGVGRGLQQLHAVHRQGSQRARHHRDRRADRLRLAHAPVERRGRRLLRQPGRVHRGQPRRDRGYG